jgi:hypothetical protein
MTFGKSKEYSRNLALILITSISIETVYHSVMDEHVVHELTFLLLIILVANQTRGLINQRVKQAEDKRMLKKLAIFGTGESRPDISSSTTHENSLQYFSQDASSSDTYFGNSTSSSALSSQLGSVPWACLGVSCWSSTAGGIF